jgi:hypothetical protein
MDKESGTQSSDELDVVVVRSIEGIEAIRQTWERLQSDEPCPRVNADIDRYLANLTTVGRDAEPYIMVVEECGRPAALLIGLVEKSRLRCPIGRKTLFEPVLRQLAVVYGGVIGRITSEICHVLVGELLKLLRTGQVDVVFFNHLETDSTLYRVARTMPGLFCRDYFPKAEQHWCMSIPDHKDRFWQACSHNRRRNFRRWTKKLEKRYPGQVKMVTFSRQEEIEEGLRVAAGISANTYQRAFGGGLAPDAKTRALFEAAAQKGWLRIHILFVAEEPCAFWTALKYKRTYFAEFTGYSPKWGDLHVGSILFLKVVEEICGDPAVNAFDFGFGEGQHKEGGDSRQLEEASVFIFAPRPFPVFVNLIRSSTLATSMLAQRAIAGLGIRNLVQRYRRRRILHKHPQAECD